MARRSAFNIHTPKPPVPIDEPVVLEEPKVEETVEEIKEEPEVETAEGYVNGVETALNIRRKPEVAANNQIGIVGKGSKIIIVDPKKPVKNKGEEWYKVLLNGEPGFAMKKYIIVK